MKKWEYKIDRFSGYSKASLEIWLDELGEDGWELAAILSVNSIQPNDGWYYFKREKKNG